MIVKAKVKEPFMHNGELLPKGKVVSLDLETAVNLMRVGTLERDEKAIAEMKKVWKSRAESIIKETEKL